MRLPCPYACYMSGLSHRSWFDQLNNVCWGVQIMKLLNVKFSPFLNTMLRSARVYLLVFMLEKELTLVQNNRTNYCPVHFNFYILDRKWEHKILDWIVAGILWTQSAVIFHIRMHFVGVFSSILKVDTFRTGNVFLYVYLYVMILSCVVFTEREFHLHPFLSQLPY
jgi:hypothetical protein